MDEIYDYTILLQFKGAFVCSGRQSRIFFEYLYEYMDAAKASILRNLFQGAFTSQQQAFGLFYAKPADIDREVFTDMLYEKFGKVGLGNIETLGNGRQRQILLRVAGGQISFDVVPQNIVMAFLP